MSGDLVGLGLGLGLLLGGKGLIIGLGCGCAVGAEEMGSSDQGVMSSGFSVGSDTPDTTVGIG